MKLFVLLLLLLNFNNYIDAQASVQCLDFCEEEGAMWGSEENEVKCADHVVKDVNYGNLQLTLGRDVLEGLNNMAAGFWIIETGDYQLMGIASGIQYTTQISYMRRSKDWFKTYEQWTHSGFYGLGTPIQTYSNVLLTTFSRFTGASTWDRTSVIKFSIDQGETWESASSSVGWPGPLSMGIIELANSDHLFYSGLDRYQNYKSYGYHSYDGGLNWSKRVTIHNGGAHWNSLNSYYVSKKNPGRIFIAFWSTHSTNRDANNSGLFLSTDHGITWTRQQSLGNYIRAPLEFGPYRGNLLRSYRKSYSGSPGQLTWLMSNDDGDTWFNAPAEFQVNEKRSITYSDDGRMYFSTGSDCGFKGCSTWSIKRGKLEVSDDHGLTRKKFGSFAAGTWRRTSILFVGSKVFFYYGGYTNGQTHGYRGEAYPNDNGVKVVEFDFINKVGLDPNGGETSCSQACINDADCCLYLWDEANSCCTLRRKGCYERKGLESVSNDYENMCTTDNSKDYPGIKSVAPNCKEWCDNSNIVQDCTPGATTSCFDIVPANLRKLINRNKFATIADVKNACKVNKPIVGSQNLSKKIYIAATKALVIPKRNSFNLKKKKRMIRRIYERMHKQFLAFNRSLGLKDVRLLSIKIAKKLASSGRRMLLSSSYENIIEYEISTNSTDEADIEEFVQIIGSDDNDYSELAQELLNDAEFMEDEPTFDISAVHNDENTPTSYNIIEDNIWDPEDPKWCKWTL